MKWQEALEIVISEYKNESYRNKCDSSHPKFIFWRNEMIRMASGENLSNQNTVISTGNGNITTIPTSESIQLMKEMKSCLHYEKQGCNTCGKAFCKIGKGEPGDRVNSTYGLVSTWDCFHCLRPDVELYAIHAYKKIS